jgi:dTMP kinase
VKRHGRLIVLEGIDGSGKSTLLQRLAARFRSDGLDVLTTREPGGTAIGEAVRSLLLTPERAELLPISELLLFLVCRAQLTMEVILPAMDAGQTVISSRYRMSSVAFQGYGRGLDRGLIQRLNDLATQNMQPDLVVVLDLPVELALARRGRDPDRIEREDRAFHERVRRGYLELAKGAPHAIVVDARSDPDALTDEVWAALRR